MIRAFLSVGLWTLVSRLTGFLRDVLLSYHLGTGLLADAFAMAFRLPNHFRAIFAEGAFSTAFVPAVTRVKAEAGAVAALRFQGGMLSLMLASQIALLALVLAFTPGFVALLAPGFAARPDAMALTVELTRITFPYLALVTLVVLWSGVLNAEQRFAEGAAAPVLLNLAMIGTLLAGARFATHAHAAAWGVFVAGFLEAALLAWGAKRMGLLARPRRPMLDADTRRFFKAFGPAVIGAGGVQIALFADTILVSFLPQSGVSSLYFADRLYQLPVGVIGIAAGTVVLPTMAKLIADGKAEAAHHAQAHALALSWLIAMPFLVAFLAIPERVVAAVFGYGAFGTEAIAATSAVLGAYGIGLLAVVGMRSAVASFHARGDTTTPLYASIAGILFNLALKFLLWRTHGAAGLAFATACGALLNFAILAVLALRQGKAGPDRGFYLFLSLLVIGGIWLAATFRFVEIALAGSGWPALALAAAHGLIGAGVYGMIVFAGARIAGLTRYLQRGSAISAG